MGDTATSWLVYAYMRTENMIRTVRRIGKIQTESAREAFREGRILAKRKLKAGTYYAIEIRRADAPSLKKLLALFVSSPKEGKPGKAHAWRMSYYRRKRGQDNICLEDTLTVDSSLDLKDII